MINTPTRLRILILGDNPDDAELLVRELQRANFDPDWKLVNTEQDYLTHLNPAIDVILSDYFMPGFSGLRTLRLLRERGLGSPFTLISGTVGTEVAVAAIQTVATKDLLKRGRQLANMLEHAAATIIAVDEGYQIIVFKKAA